MEIHQPASLSGSGVDSLNGLTGDITLAQGSNITITPSGNTLTIASTGGSSLTLQTNGTPNGSQTLLNLKAGTNMTLTDDGVGGVTFDATGGGGTNYWTASGNDIHNNNIGSVGIGQTTPLAQLHVTAFPMPSSFTASLAGIATSGYSFGHGNISYNLYSEDSTKPLFSEAVSTTFTEPASSTYDPQNPTSCAFNPSGGGYTASGYDFNYTIYALYIGQTAISVGSVTTGGTGTDPNDGSTYNVDVSWTAPTGPAPDAYLVQCNGFNPNSSLYQVIGGTSFSDTNTGWVSSPNPSSYTTIKYQVSLTWSGAASPVDNYVLYDTTDGTSVSVGNVTSATDDAAWAGGVPTVTPTASSIVEQLDGSKVVWNGVSYVLPSSIGSGVFLKTDGVGNMLWGSVNPGDIPATSDQILYGAGGNVGQSQYLEYSLSSGEPKMSVGSNGAALITTFNVAGDFQYGGFLADSTGSGTQNNFNVDGYSVLRFGNTSTTYTGFTSRGGQLKAKVLYVINAGTTVTLANESSSSSANARIITGSGTDLVLFANQVATLLYSSNATRWVVQNVSSIFQNQTGILSSTTGINGKTVTNTNLYTVPSGRTAIITGYVVRCSAASSITVGASAGIGNSGGTNNIVASQAMTALLTTSDLYVWNIQGGSKTVAAGSSVFFNLGTAATGTSQTLIVELIGYLL